MRPAEECAEPVAGARTPRGIPLTTPPVSADARATPALTAGASRDRWVGIGATMLAAISFGVQGVLGKYASAGGASVPTLLTLRFGVATLIVWALLLAPRLRGGPGLLRQPRRRLLGFGVLGLLFVTNSLFYFQALAFLPVGTATLLVYLFPALVVLWSALFFGERLTRAKLGALALALLGCALTIDPAAALAAGAAFSWVGVALALGSALSNSWYATLAAPLGRGVPGVIVTAYSLPVTAACFGGAALATRSFSGDMSPGGWSACLAIGALTGGAIALFLFGIARIGASRAAVVATSEPATAVLLGALLFAEPLTPPKLLGGACILAGVLLVSRQQAEPLAGDGGGRQ